MSAIGRQSEVQTRWIGVGKIVQSELLDGSSSAYRDVTVNQTLEILPIYDCVMSSPGSMLREILYRWGRLIDYGWQCPRRICLEIEQHGSRGRWRSLIWGVCGYDEHNIARGQFALLTVMDLPDIARQIRRWLQDYNQPGAWQLAFAQFARTRDIVVLIGEETKNPAYVLGIRGLDEGDVVPLRYYLEGIVQKRRARYKDRGCFRRNPWRTP